MTTTQKTALRKILRARTGGGRLAKEEYQRELAIAGPFLDRNAGGITREAYAICRDDKDIIEMAKKLRNDRSFVEMFRRPQEPKPSRYGVPEDKILPLTQYLEAGPDNAKATIEIAEKLNKAFPEKILALHAKISGFHIERGENYSDTLLVKVAPDTEDAFEKWVLSGIEDEDNRVQGLGTHSPDACFKEDGQFVLWWD